MLIFSLCFIDKYATEQSFIMVDCNDNFQLMLTMYHVEKELTVYVTTNNNVETSSMQQRGQDDVHDEEHGEEESEYSLSDESYHSHYSTDNEIELQNSQSKTCRKESRIIKVNSIFENVIEFRRALAHYAIMKYMDRRWEVSLDERTCTCRVWQIKGIPCVHAAAFITFTRDVNWENYVDSYFTIEKFKLAYALKVAPMPAKDEWVHIETEEKIYPPAIKRLFGRPRKNRIKPKDEPKKRHKCPLCGEYGHRENTCKNSAS